MANVAHSSLTSTELHVPKGASTATAGEVFIADGSGDGVFQTHTPMGSWTYDSIGTGTTFTTPTTNTLMNLVSVTSHLRDFTNNSLGRLTYTGADNRTVHCFVDITFKHSTGSGQDVYFDFAKNGTVLSHEKVQTADSANFQHISMQIDTPIVTNDYIEVFLRTSTGNVIVHASYMSLLGMPS